MNEVKKASFAFKGYQVKKFSFEEPSDSSIDSFTIGFDPSGIYDPKSGLFQVNFQFKAFIKGETEQNVVTAFLSADFQFMDNLALNEIPSYFYKNSIAIVFPYLRSFVSTLTFQANVKPMILPVLNLSDLEEPLRQNTVIAQ
ncbi:MAG: hypothetical protein O9302_08785 [Cyclobacteriaceae bacterium]|jgi:preprotein translocase subunit SecB|nr:hypothetical protein [Cytophagales bacterium]MCZ8328140.1 hypothetical protein [Cyclobacteriaceae bacterium]